MPLAAVGLCACVVDASPRSCPCVADDDSSWPDGGAETHLGRYELVRRLGKGGMGEVFLAKAQGARGFEKFVAIKRILPQYSANRHVVNMLVDEARISVLLNHPNVVQVMELDEDQGSHFIVMEYVDGHALSRMIRRLKKRGERVDPLVASYIMIQVLEGLHAAHTQHDNSGQLAGIIHRDVSPQNVLISMTGQVKVIDFGIARARDRLEATQGAQVKGKLRYMAPEQIKPSMAGSGGIDHRVDVFAAGIVLFEMLAMRQRFPQTGDIEIIDAILESDPPDLEREGLIDRELMDIVRTALCRERKRRFKDAAAFGAALRGYLYARDPSFNGERLAKAMRRVFLDEAPDANEVKAPPPAPRERDERRRAQPLHADEDDGDDGDADDVTRTQFRPPKAALAAPPAAAPSTTMQRAPAPKRRGIPAPVIGAALGAVVLLALGPRVPWPQSSSTLARRWGRRRRRRHRRRRRRCQRQRQRRRHRRRHRCRQPRRRRAWWILARGWSSSSRWSPPPPPSPAPTFLIPNTSRPPA